jgi:hypothetical protein
VALGHSVDHVGEIRLGIVPVVGADVRPTGRRIRISGRRDRRLRALSYGTRRQFYMDRGPVVNCFVVSASEPIGGPSTFGIDPKNVNIWNTSVGKYAGNVADL